MWKVQHRYITGIDRYRRSTHIQMDILYLISEVRIGWYYRCAALAPVTDLPIRCSKQINIMQPYSKLHYLPNYWLITGKVPNTMETLCWSKLTNGLSQGLFHPSSYVVEKFPLCFHGNIYLSNRLLLPG